MTATQNPAQDVSDAAIAQAFREYPAHDDSSRWIARRARELQQAQVVGVPYGIIDPDYARIFTIARVLAWSEGYALTMHGSFTRDLDLVAVPWTDRAREPEHLARRIIETCGLKDTASNPGIKPHGRLVWTMRLPDFGDPRFVDFSILSTPQSSATQQAQAVGERAADWPSYNAAVAEYVDDYEYMGETEDGREGCYTPTERERMLILDAMNGFELLPPVPATKQDLRSCTICGLTVDLTKGHVAPSGDFSTAGQPHATRSRKSTAKGDAP